MTIQELQAVSEAIAAHAEAEFARRTMLELCEAGHTFSRRYFNACPFCELERLEAIKKSGGRS